MSNALANPSRMREIHWPNVFLGLALMVMGSIIWLMGSAPEFMLNVIYVPLLFIPLHVIWGWIRPAAYESKRFALLRGFVFLVFVSGFFLDLVFVDAHELTSWCFIISMLAMFLLGSLANLQTRRRRAPHRLASILATLYALLAIGGPVGGLGVAVLYSIRADTCEMMDNLTLIIVAMFGVLMPLAGILEVLKAVVYGRGAGCAGGNRDGNNSDPAAG